MVGNSTNIQDKDMLWMGLESYSEKNSSIFYGREDEIEQLAADIFHNPQTVIYGPSGTGKTSIIRAGIFRKARENRYLPVYIRLSHDNIEGNKSYIQQIIDAIVLEATSHKIEIDKTIPYINQDDKGAEVCLSLWEFFHCNEFWNEENYQIVPLIVLDQFEEIFTLCKDSQTQAAFFEQLSDLCDNKYPKYVQDYIGDRDNSCASYPETVNFRCVLSLREDFLARLEEQAEKIPSLKRNRFSLQCISEEQALDIIMKPQPGLVSEDVAIQIIERVTNKKYREDFTIHDQPDIIVEPSILSLFCSELDKIRNERGLDIISQDLIGEFGDNIIKDFYINCVKDLSAHKISFLP